MLPSFVYSYLHWVCYLANVNFRMISRHSILFSDILRSADPAKTSAYHANFKLFSRRSFHVWKTSFFLWQLQTTSFSTPILFGQVKFNILSVVKLVKFAKMFHFEKPFLAIGNRNFCLHCRRLLASLILWQICGFFFQIFVSLSDS